MHTLTLGARGVITASPSLKMRLVTRAFCFFGVAFLPLTAFFLFGAGEIQFDTVRWRNRCVHFIHIRRPIIESAPTRSLKHRRMAASVVSVTVRGALDEAQPIHNDARFATRLRSSSHFCLQVAQMRAFSFISG